MNKRYLHSILTESIRQVLKEGSYLPPLHGQITIYFDPNKKEFSEQQDATHTEEVYVELWANEYYVVERWDVHYPEKLHIEDLDADVVLVNGECVYEDSLTYCGLDGDTFERMICDFITSHHLEQDLFDPNDIETNV